MKENIILQKSMNFSIRIVNLYKTLADDRREYTMSRQVLRCGTGIGAKAHEANNAESEWDFLTLMNVALKLATETEYWITLLGLTNYLAEEESASVLRDCVELKKILTSMVKTMKTRLNPSQIN